jgi:hypothetical protein
LIHSELQLEPRPTAAFSTSKIDDQNVGTVLSGICKAVRLSGWGEDPTTAAELHCEAGGERHVLRSSTTSLAAYLRALHSLTKLSVVDFRKCPESSCLQIERRACVALSRSSAFWDKRIAVLGQFDLRHSQSRKTTTPTLRR